MTNRIRLEASYAGFSLDVDIAYAEQVLVLFGASGSGKTTIIEGICGLRPEVGGTIRLGGHVLQQAGGPRVAPAERFVGWVPQDASLFPHLTVRQNIEFGARRASEPARRDHAIEVLNLTALLDRSVGALSGGERQRVALARALSSGAQVIVADEPLASLDTALRARILTYFVRLQRELKVPFVYVSHDPSEVRALAGHVAVLSEGRVVAQGPPGEVLYTAPALSVLEALGAENAFDVSVVGASDGLRTVRTDGGVELLMGPAGQGVSTAGGPERLRIAVRAEDVLLSSARLSGTSARNHLEARVVALEPAGASVWVRARAGDDHWVVRVTMAGANALSLEPGAPVWLVIKTSAIHALSDGSGGA